MTTTVIRMEISRHHTNPVGTEWKWQMDDPEMIMEQALKNQANLVKQLNGLPGAKQHRLNEAKVVKHCALSLVGEPIMYPKINRLIHLLHQRQISTFFVTNAQFPDAIRNLSPVTQLYVSVDAASEKSLKKIDRPLFRDFWRRFLDSMKALKEKRQRTVYRLTLVKGFNVDDLKGYAELVRMGEPDFIEIKGVTYCGESKTSVLTMENVPWHADVVNFASSLIDFLPESSYEIAAEHEHSNCILIANTKVQFKIDNCWHTWIDYERFAELISSELDQFCSLDYAAKTPSWAVFGSSERGFDPQETRWLRNKQKTVKNSGC